MAIFVRTITLSLEAKVEVGMFVNLHAPFQKTVLDQCPTPLPLDALIVLGDFIATTKTERAAYKLCFGPHNSGTRNNRINSSSFLHFARLPRPKSKNCSFLGTRDAPLDMV